MKEREDKAPKVESLIKIRFSMYIYRLTLTEAKTVFRALDAVHDIPEITDMHIKYREDDTMNIYPPFIAKVHDELKKHLEAIGECDNDA